MNRIHFKPSKYLSNYIDRYFVCTQSKSLPLILPGTGLELLFHLEKPLAINNKTLSSAHTICPRERLLFNKTNTVNYISVRFHSGSFRHFTNIPHKYVINNFLTVEDIWQKEGVEFLNEIFDTNSILQKIQLIESFLLRQLNKHQLIKSINWDASIKTLYKNFNKVTLHQLANDCNLSFRQYERVFKQNFGITPKKFQQITRLQKTVKEILLQKKTHYLYTALDNGYFDQSHFIKEFKNFTGIKPTDYFIIDNLENHFYYKPLD